MDNVIIEKRRGKQYIFSEESIIVNKRNRIIRNIPMQDIRIIRYCSKFQLKDTLLAVLFRTVWCELPQPYKSFDIHLKNNKKVVRLWMKKEEFEKVKVYLQCPIQIL